MKKLLLILLFFSLCFSNGFAQLPNGSIAPDWTLTDINGTTHNLYSYLDSNYTVFILFQAYWDPAGWSYHTSGALENLYINHGPAGFPNVSANTTDDVMVFFIEGDGNNLACLQGLTVGCNSSLPVNPTIGNWTTGTSFPMFLTPTPFPNALTLDYNIIYWPTVYKVCPNKYIQEIGQNQNPYSFITNLYNSIFIIACGSYTFGGINYTTSGIYTQTFTNSIGCDSVVELTLTINNNNVSSTINVTDCDSIILNGNTYFTNGTYIDTLISSSGCDSILTINVTVVNCTAIPDNNFEAYLENNGMGNGTLSDDLVITNNIVSVPTLNISGQNISDLTGIEDFASLQYLDCSNNSLTDLDVSNNTQLSNLQCEANILSTLSFDVSLTSLDCFNNQLTSLDLSNNPNISFLNCSYNNLVWVDLRNGNNQVLVNPNFTGNPLLSCLNVDDPPTSDDDWPWDDPWSVYATSCDPINSWNCVGNDCLGDSTGQGMYTVLGDCQTNCGVSSVLDNNIPAKKLIKVIDVLGRHTEQTNESILFYLFDDGTVEKRIVIE